MNTSRSIDSSIDSIDRINHIKQHIVDVPDFPKEGILFRDITPVLEDSIAFQQVIDLLTERYHNQGITRVAGIESRGFIFGAPLALALGCGLSLIRKPGKLPRKTLSASYTLEYGEDTVHLHCDSISQTDRVLLVDDLIATGGTAAAAASLITTAGATLHEITAVIELDALEGRKRLAPHAVFSLIHYA